jgi:hypothetical protein
MFAPPFYMPPWLRHKEKIVMPSFSPPAALQRPYEPEQILPNFKKNIVLIQRIFKIPKHHGDPNWTPFPT